jgi:hypothetical protein
MPSNQNNSYVLNAEPAMDRINSYPNSSNDPATLLNTTVTSEPYRLAFNGAESSVRDRSSSHEQQQSIAILPLVNESTIYSGTITFTANNPISLQIYHLYHKTDNMQSITVPRTPATLGKSSNISITTITPQYSTLPLQYSATVPFIGSSLALTSKEQAFTAVFSVVADVNRISDNRIRTNSSSTSSTLDQQKVQALQPVTSYTLPPTNLVAQLLLESPPELVSQIPLDHLAQKDIVEVFNNIPKNKIATVIKQMPQERVAAILSKLPEKDRNELKNFISQSIH